MGNPSTASVGGTALRRQFRHGQHFSRPCLQSGMDRIGEPFHSPPRYPWQVRRIWIGVGVAVLAVAVLAGGYALGHESSSSGPGSSAKVNGVVQPSTTVATLPVVACPSTYGIGAAPPPKYPDTWQLKLPVDVTSEVAFYSDQSRSVQPVLGPKGWSCTASIGADGSTVLALLPPGGPNVAIVPGSPTTDKEFVYAYSPSACQGCIANLVCSVFPSAIEQLGYAGQSCPTLPPAETDEFSSGSVAAGYGTVAFVDPPGVQGTGGADSPNAAIGTLRFGIPPGAGQASAVLLSCVLPASLKPICAATNQEFVAQNWGMSSAPTAPPPTTTNTTEP